LAKAEPFAAGCWAARFITPRSARTAALPSLLKNRKAGGQALRYKLNTAVETVKAGEAIHVLGPLFPKQAGCGWIACDGR
jgi:hypothetical protein